MRAPCTQQRPHTGSHDFEPGFETELAPTHPREPCVAGLCAVARPSLLRSAGIGFCPAP